MSLLAQGHMQMPAFDPISGLTNTGADLSGYSADLACVRVARTLDFRRACTEPANHDGSKESSKKASGAGDASQKEIDVQSAVSILSASNQANIVALCQQVIQAAPKRPKQLKAILANQAVQGAFVSALSKDFSEPTICCVLDAISLSFPILQPEQMENFINAEIPSSIFNFIFTPSVPLLTSCVELIRSVSEASSYGRDAFINFGFHTTLIDIAKSHASEELTDLACSAIYQIFQNPGPMEPTTVVECVKPMVELLNGLDEQATLSLLHAFVEMSDKAPSMIFNLFDLGFYPIAVSLLDNPAYMDVALCLIGNLSNAQPIQIKALIEAGLLDRLVALLQDGHLSDIFWVFSNLLESAPPLLLPIFTAEFVKNAALITKEAPCGVKNEAAFFISTAIHFSGSSSASSFLDQGVIELLVEVLGCGINDTVMRCLDAINALVTSAQSSSQALSIFLDTDIKDRLEDLADGDTSKISANAKYLLSQLSGSD